MPTALDGLRIIDFSRILAGPFATMMLADLGAEVTKIERPGAGDDTRSWGPPFDATGAATYFQAVNRNKTSLAIDLSDPAGQTRARGLVTGADVLVENFRPGFMERIGLGEATLRSENPGLIYCSITGFGRAEGAALTGYDLLVQAMGGLMSITGEPDGPPEKVGVALVDVLTGLFAVTGILAALEYRHRSGEGQRIEVNLLSVLLGSLVNQASAYTIGGVIPRRLGNAHPSIVPYDLYATAAGSLVLAIGNDRQFATLCRVIGATELRDDPRFATNALRVDHRDALRVVLEQRLALRSAGTWEAELTAAGVPAGQVNDVAEAFALAERLGLHPTVEIPREDGPPVRLARNPIELSATPPRYVLPPPRLPEG